MTRHSASCSPKHTEDEPITAIQKACQSVSRRCLLCSIEQGNLWEKAMSINQLVLVSRETRTVLTASFLKTPKLRKWSVDQGNLRREKAQMHRLGPYLMYRDRWLSQSIARKFVITNSKQLMSKKKRRIPREELWRQQMDFREVHQQSLTEMEELRKFQSCTFDTLAARRKLIEDQNTILELSGRVQELQNEVNCNERFWGLPGRWISSQWKFPRNQSTNVFPNTSDTWRDVEAFLHIAAPQRRAAMHLGHMVFRETFLQIHMHLHQLLILENWIHGVQQLRSRFIRLQMRKVKDQNKIEIWDASLDRQPKIQSIFSGGDSSKNYGADQQRLQISDLHFDKFPTPATFACWKIRFKTEVCTCSQFPTEAMQWIKEVELVDSADELRSSSSTRGISRPNFEVLDARIASALEENHP